jgi:polyisoprenoid-binding protein YceI
VSGAFVFTFKEGLLSPLAHDLKIRVTKHEIQGQVATFDASSLRVESASGALPTHFYPEIETAIREDVLHSAKFPVIRFEATEVKETEILGRLTLHGVTREIRVSKHGNVLEYQLDQREFGIKPYSAMLGTLKVKPVIKVQVAL